MLDDWEKEKVKQKMIWQFVAEHYDELRKICLRASRGDVDYADELMSDEIYRQLPKLIDNWDLIRPFPVYVFNHFRLHLRKISARRFIRKTEQIYEETTCVKGSKGQCEQDNKIEVEELLSLLPELERNALTLVVMHGYSYREVADMFDCSNGYIHKIVHKALNKLKPPNGNQLPS